MLTSSVNVARPIPIFSARMPQINRQSDQVLFGDQTPRDDSPAREWNIGRALVWVAGILAAGAFFTTTTIIDAGQQNSKREQTQKACTAASATVPAGSTVECDIKGNKVKITTLPARP